MRLRLVSIGSGLCIAICAAVLTGCGSSPRVREAKYLSRGQMLLAKKDFTRALLEFRNASKAMPEDPEPYYRMGLACLESGSLANAIGFFRKALEFDPKQPGAQLKLAELKTASQSKDLIQEAASSLEGLLANSPANTEANDALALAEWKLGDSSQATRRLEETLSRFPTRLASSVALARVKLSQRDFTGAVDILKQASANAPQSWEAAVALGQLYLLLRQPQNAEPEMHRALTLNAGNGAALLGLAAIQMAGNRLDEAGQTYQQLAALPQPEYRPLHALFLYRTGQRDAALAELGRLAAQDPGNRAARNRLLAAFVDMSKLAEAHRLLAAALKKNPQDADALFQRSQLYWKSGNSAEAEKDLKHALHYQPDSAEAHLALAAIYRAGGLKRSERQELDEVLRLDGNLLPARLAMARNLMTTGDANSALDLLNAAPEAQKKTLPVIAERNWALLAAGDTGELRRALDRDLKAGRFPELVIQDAILKMQAADFAGARADAEEILRRYPEDIRAARLLADSYLAQKNPLKAGEVLATLAGGHSRSAPLQNLLGEWYLSAGKLAEARAAFEAASAAAPGFTPAALGLAGIARRENRLDEAHRLLSVILATAPQNLPALLMSASIEAETGNRAGAIARYRAVLDRDDSNLFALNNLAYNLALDDPEEALQFAQRAAEIAPENPSVQDTLGWVYYRKGIFTAAAGYLKSAVAKSPTPRRQFHLAMSYMKLGEKDLGEKTLHEALAQDPGLTKTEQGW